MKSTNKLNWIAIAILLVSMQSYATGMLIGIWNSLTPASNAPDPYAPRIELAGKGSVIGMPYACNVQLPVEVNLYFTPTRSKNPESPIPYTIRIEESSTPGTCPGGKVRVVAYVKGLEMYAEAKQETCVNGAVSFLKRGDRVLQWQNIMLFLADNPKYDPQTPGSLPFKMGLAAWTSTKSPWNQQMIYQTPQDLEIALPRYTFSDGLHVIQGQQAIGGGNIPRPYFGDIVHLFNDTNKIIMLRRYHPDPVFTPYNFQLMIPPKSTIPFINTWLPKVASQYVNTPSGIPIPRREPMELYFLKISERGRLPSGFSPIGEIGGKEYTYNITENDINRAMDTITQNMTDNAANIYGYDITIDTMETDPTEMYYVGNDYYKLYSTEDTNKTVHINKVPLTGAGDETIIYSGQAPAYVGVTPTYFRLVITEDADGKPRLNLDRMSLESSFDY